MRSVSEIMAHFGEKPAQQARAVSEGIGADYQAVRMWPMRGRVPVEWILPFVEFCRSRGLADVDIALVTRLSAERAGAEKTNQPAA